MAHQHSIRNKQSEQGTSVTEEHGSTDDMDIFDQLQQEFDTLISDDASDVSPPAFSDNSDESFGELPTSDEQTDAPASTQEQQATEQLVYDTPIKPDSVDDNLMEDDDQKSMHNEPDQSIADKEKESDMPVSTIIMLGLAVAILMAAVAGSIWAYYYPSSQQAASNKQSAKDTPQVIITKQARAVKYIPINKPDSNARKQSAAHTDSAPTRSGDWIINLESFNTSDDANAYAARLTQRDIHADIMAVQIKGKAWYRVRLTGFPSRQEAETQRLILVKKLKLNSAWISKFRR